MDSIAFVIPIHPPKYIHIYNILDKCNDIVLYLVFSNTNDYDLFLHKEKIKAIIIPQYLSNNEVPIIVNKKKYYALQQLKNCSHEFLIVCDAEIDIIDEHFTETNILNQITQLYNNKRLYSFEDSFYHTQDIFRESTRLLNDDAYNIVQRKSDNFNFCLWWCDIPAIKVSYLEDFLEKIDINKNISNLNYKQWDHVTYGSYLLAYHDFEIINCSKTINHNGDMQCYITHNVDDLHLLKNINKQFSWVFLHLYNLHKDFFINEKTFLIYHIDR